MPDKTIALVTGASRGIGRAIATRLGADGMTVIGTATSDGGAEAISRYFGEAGIQGQGMKLDVSDDDSVTEVIGAIADQYGPVTVLVNNAGITRDNLLLRMKPEEWDAVINTNLSSLYRVCKACIRGMMKARGGRIVNIASVVGSSGNAGQTNYSAAKAGMLGFTKSLAQEIGSRGITVNAVAPGFIDTDMTRELPEAQRNALLSAIPLGRLGSAEEIAAAVAFLASEDAAYVTGTTLHVNGGMYMV
ncbi:3-oxoacyl-ACP reductase FabG [Thiolapillus sp.]